MMEAADDRPVCLVRGTLRKGAIRTALVEALERPTNALTKDGAEANRGPEPVVSSRELPGQAEEGPDMGKAPLLCSQCPGIAGRTRPSRRQLSCDRLGSIIGH